MGIRERVNQKRAQILQVAGRFGARNVRVIGSVARGEAGPESDLDLLVDLEEGRSLLDHAALMIELEKLLGCKVDVAIEQGLRPRVRDRVLGEAVPFEARCRAPSGRLGGDRPHPAAGREGPSGL